MKTTSPNSKKIIRSRWHNMKARCLNKEHPKYQRYGGRGITICERWLNFENFFVDVLPFFSNKLSIDRIDNNKGYYPENIQWITIDRNRRKRAMPMNEFLELEKTDAKKKKVVVLKGSIKPQSMSTKKITFNLLDEVAEKIEELRKRRGQSQSLYITNLILKDK